MTQNTIPPVAEPAWSETPRRADAIGWNEHARYGASLVAAILGAYLYATAPLSQLAQAFVFSMGPGPEHTILLLSRSLFAVVVLTLAFVIAPTTIGRRIGAASVVVGGTIFVVALTVLRFSTPLPGGPFWFVALHPLFLATLFATIGWLIVRERPGLSYLLVIPILLVGLVPFWMLMADLPSGVVELVVTPLAFVLGIGVAWGARAMAAARR